MTAIEETETPTVLGAPDDRIGRPARPEPVALVEPVRRPSSVSVRGRRVRPTPLAWLPWAALGLAAVIVLAMVLIAAASAKDDGDPSDVTTPTTVAAPAPSTTAAAPEAASPAAAAPEPPAASAPTPTVIAADGRSLLPLPPEGLQVAAGQPVEGHGVVVQSVVADEGFWVGDDETDRIFVHGTSETPFKVEPGQRIDFSATLTALTDTPSKLGVSKDEGADQLRSLGHYLEATSVAPSA